MIKLVNCSGSRDVSRKTKCLNSIESWQIAERKLTPKGSKQKQGRVCWKNIKKSPLKAPELNPELLPLLHKTAKSRYKYLSANQDLCGRGLVALGKYLDAIFNDEEEPIHKDTLLE